MTHHITGYHKDYQQNTCMSHFSFLLHIQAIYHAIGVSKFTYSMHLLTQSDYRTLFTCNNSKCKPFSQINSNMFMHVPLLLSMANPWPSKLFLSSLSHYPRLSISQGQLLHFNSHENPTNNIFSTPNIIFSFKKNPSFYQLPHATNKLQSTREKLHGNNVYGGKRKYQDL